MRCKDEMSRNAQMRVAGWRKMTAEPMQARADIHI